ncbi:unnamed protein product [Parnassius apollo]|uniref:(apollo) hypothetical protein n=1 Tax=Parnassius apollo TaxID=110799 RepID=A0A8S3XT87_PARAO|nr:unnamed protein product [Parnassius apollo]
MFVRRHLIFYITTIILISSFIQAQDGISGRYGYNHPPSAESDDIVPVAVDYGNGKARENKAIRHSSDLRMKPEEDTVITKELSKQSDFPPKTKIPVKMMVNDQRELVSIHGKIEGYKPNISSREGSLNEPDKDRTQNITDKRKRTRMRKQFVPIITEENFVFSHRGNFHYSFEGGDGTKVFEEGNSNNKAGASVKGGFSYTDNDGNDYSLSYTADENGYRPSGAHLPTPPPIPPEIARALKYLATKSTPQPATEATGKFN